MSEVPAYPHAKKSLCLFVYVLRKDRKPSINEKKHSLRVIGILGRGHEVSGQGVVAAARRPAQTQGGHEASGQFARR